MSFLVVPLPERKNLAPHSVNKAYFYQTFLDWADFWHEGVPWAGPQPQEMLKSSTVAKKSY